MHSDNMPSRSHSAQWEDIMECKKAGVIKLFLEKEFPQYDFNCSGSPSSFRNPYTIQVARGLSDNEFHVILGFVRALNLLV